MLIIFKEINCDALNYSVVSRQQLFQVFCSETSTPTSWPASVDYCAYWQSTTAPHSFSGRLKLQDWTQTEGVAVAVLRWGHGAQPPNLAQAPQIFGHSSSATGWINWFYSIPRYLSMRRDTVSSLHIPRYTVYTGIPCILQLESY